MRAWCHNNWGCISEFSRPGDATKQAEEGRIRHFAHMLVGEVIDLDSA